MKSKVDVRLARDTLANLRPPPSSIVDGQKPASVEHVCCRSAGGLSKVAVWLPVDEATALRFARTCQLERMWRRKIIPFVLAGGALGLAVLAVAAAGGSL